MRQKPETKHLNEKTTFLEFLDMSIEDYLEKQKTSNLYKAALEYRGHLVTIEIVKLPESKGESHARK